MGERIRFEVVLQPEGTSAYAIVPDEIGAHLGVRGRTSVVGTINGHPFRNQVMPYGFEDGSKRLLMPVNNAVRKAAGGIAQDAWVVFELERDDASRSAVLDNPPVLAAALESDIELRRAWDALSPSRRREAAEHIAAARRDETRTRRLREVLAGLR
jgi:hypothetical protein